jgi:hypothetical protein
MITVRTREGVTTIASVPDTGAIQSASSVTVVWDPGAPLADIEESIKASARKAIARAREVFDGLARPSVASHAVGSLR